MVFSFLIGNLLSEQRTLSQSSVKVLDLYACLVNKFLEVFEHLNILLNLRIAVLQLCVDTGDRFFDLVKGILYLVSLLGVLVGERADFLRDNVEA